jgi:hypothetical protein
MRSSGAVQADLEQMGHLFNCSAAPAAGTPSLHGLKWNVPHTDFEREKIGPASH